MRPFALAALVATSLSTVLSTGTLPAQTIEGTWEGRFREGADPVARLQLTADWDGELGSYSSTMRLSEAERRSLAEGALAAAPGPFFHEITRYVLPRSHGGPRIRRSGR